MESPVIYALTLQWLYQPISRQIILEIFFTSICEMQTFIFLRIFLENWMAIKETILIPLKSQNRKMAEISEGNFLNAESCSEIDFQTYQFSSDVFVLCCVKWQSCAPAHRCRANVNVSLDFAWQQLCPQPRRFPVPTTAARSTAKLGGGGGCTRWQFLSSLSIYAGSVDQNP